MTNTNPNVIQEFFVPINKIRPRKEEEPIPELIHVPQADPTHSNPKVAEWMADVKKRERK